MAQEADDKLNRKEVRIQDNVLEIKKIRSQKLITHILEGISGI